MARAHPPATATLAGYLGEAGHATTSCGWCGGVLAADLDHSGAPLNPHNRSYCTPAHRTAARNRRRALARRPEAVAATRLRAALTHRRQLEDAGQLDLTGLPLPDLPDETHDTAKEATP